MEIVSNVALISINETLIVQLISFLIFLFIINRLMFRPLKETMEVRERHIDTVRTEIEDAGNKLDRIRAELLEREKEVRKEADQIRKDLEESGGLEAATIFADISREISLQRQKTQKEIEARIEASKSQIKKEAEFLAVSLMEKLLDRRLA